ncbi:MAG: universal stress protein [Dehalococcoidia bacterium]|nr:universal stress protein [Dehalococcoidia bacterium]
MDTYQHILTSVDYSPHGRRVVEKARQLARIHQAQLSLLHVLDNIPMPQMPYGTVIPLDQPTDNVLLAAEKTQLIKLGKEGEIDHDHCWLVWGAPKNDITLFADNNGVDLIVVGSHGRHGIALLLGSTANAVLHHAHCDVLAVRLKD